MNDRLVPPAQRYPMMMIAGIGVEQVQSPHRQVRGRYCPDIVPRCMTCSTMCMLHLYFIEDMEVRFSASGVTGEPGLSYTVPAGKRLMPKLQ